VTATTETAPAGQQESTAPAGVAPPRSPFGVTATLRLLDRPLTSYHLIVGCTSLLLALGLVMVLSASSVEAFQLTGDSYSIFGKQLLWACIGVPAAYVASRAPVSWYRRAAIPLLLLAFGLLCLVLVPGVGVSVNGNQNWISFGGPFRVQPSEAAKLALVLWSADLLTRKYRLLTQWKHLAVPLFPVAGALLVLVMLGNDLGTDMVLVSIILAVLFVVGAPGRLFAMLGAGMVVAVTLLSVTAPHRLDRFRSWLNPDSDYLGAGWQAVHARFALGSGGWWGLGLGAGREKWGGLPEAHTDFIFAVIGEELGLIGTVAVLLLFALLVYAGLRTALRSVSLFSRLAAAGATAWIASQALVNIGAVLGLLPIAGLPLPLVSYGGSALLPTLVALGMLVAFARDEPGAREALAARGPGPLRRALVSLARTPGAAVGGLRRRRS
jgi:cell division protein FtsW